MGREDSKHLLRFTNGIIGSSYLPEIRKTIQGTIGGVWGAMHREKKKGSGLDRRACCSPIF